MLIRCIGGVVGSFGSHTSRKTRKKKCPRPLRDKYLPVWLLLYGCRGSCVLIRVNMLQDNIFVGDKVVRTAVASLGHQAPKIERFFRGITWPEDASQSENPM